MTIPLFSAPVGPIKEHRRRRRRWHRRHRGSVLLRRAVVFEVGALVALVICIAFVLD
jgi:hypothetical protein